MNQTFQDFFDFEKKSDKKCYSNRSIDDGIYRKKKKRFQRLLNDAPVIVKKDEGNVLSQSDCEALNKI